MLASDGHSHGINVCWPAPETVMVVGCRWPAVNTAIELYNGCWPAMKIAMVVGSRWPATETIMVVGGRWPAANTAMELMVAGQQ